MGLAQRKISEDYQKTVFPRWKNELDAIIGFSVPMEIAWDALIDDTRDDREQYHSAYRNTYFAPLKDVFTQICSSQLGKESLKKGLKKIVIETGDGWNQGGKVTFDDGVFKIQQRPFADAGSSSYAQTQSWKKMIEDKL